MRSRFSGQSQSNWLRKNRRIRWKMRICWPNNSEPSRVTSLSTDLPTGCRSLRCRATTWRRCLILLVPVARLESSTIQSTSSSSILTDSSLLEVCQSVSYPTTTPDSSPWIVSINKQSQLFLFVSLSQLPDEIPSVLKKLQSMIET